MTKQEFLRKIRQARKKTLEVEEIKAEILADYNLEDVPFSADNSDNLEEAIQCFIDYGELPISQNLDDFWNVYQSSVR